MDIETRIQQFTQMAQADPNNELGHFSLGKCYVEAGRFADAIAPLTRAIELNGDLSKAHQLLGAAYHGAGQRDRAIEVVTHGATVADRQGDRMPRDAMVRMLRDWNAPVPESLATSAAPQSDSSDAASGGFQCRRCGQPRGRLEKPPFKGALGEKIFTHICSTCWREWIPMGTKVINELGLVLSSQTGQEAYDQYMVEFLQLEEA